MNSIELTEDDIICVDCCQTPIKCSDVELYRSVCLDCLTDLIICRVLWNKSQRSKSTDLIVKQEKYSVNKALEEFEIAPLDL